jgi:hypothetical protein
VAVIILAAVLTIITGANYFGRNLSRPVWLVLIILSAPSTSARPTRSFFGEIKPYSGSLKDSRLDLVYYRNPGLNVGDQFPLWTLHC